jgi:hypothetical protein
VSDRLVLATRKGVLILHRTAAGWTAAPIAHPGVNVAFAAHDPRDGTLWASLDHGHWGPKMSRSRDGGLTWEDAPSIKYPEGARFVAQYMPLPGEDPDEVGKRPKYKDATLLKTWFLAFGNNDQPGVMYAGTIPGGLFVSTDGGESWELNRPLWNHESRGGDLFAGEATSENTWGGTPAAVDYGEFAPGIHSVLVDPRDSRHLYVAVSSAGVLESRDGGESWSGANKGMLMDYLPNPAAEWGHDPHYVALCQHDPDHLWQQNHCGVFYSADAAATWSKVSDPSVAVHFGFPIAADPNDGRTAWVVPGRADSHRMSIDGGLFVARTEDGGKSWQTFRAGLPQQHAYDLVYRHALDVSPCGKRVAFASTTGNCYLSEDRGETWQCLGNHFPPVYSVRFA